MPPTPERTLSPRTARHGTLEHPRRVIRTTSTSGGAAVYGGLGVKVDPKGSSGFGVGKPGLSLASSVTQGLSRQVLKVL